MGIRLYNTMGREIQDFIPINEGRVGMYTCGPTVYSYAHIGNLRTFIFEDILKRTFEYFGYSVKHVMNVTDVGHLTDDADEGEDKILKSAKEAGKTVWEIADFYTKAFFNDIALLNIETPSVICKATDHIDDMIKLIKRIEKNGFTYESGGNLYFDVLKFPDYGKLALLKLEDLKAGARIAVDEKKKNPHDFVLWFTKSKFEHQAMMWDSPWGRGYPGWHIECSAMSMKYLGDHFDIHCGGMDLIPVHHTNEIAQSEAATGKKWVNYWLHGEFLVLKKAKMSKSKGNFLTLSTLKEKGYDPLDYRYFCLSAHYRSQLQFGFEVMDSAKSGRRGLMDRVARIREEFRKEADKRADSVDRKKANNYIKSFEENISQDLNVPKALAELWGITKDSSIPASAKYPVILKMDKVLGLKLDTAELEKMDLSDDVKALVEEREQARRKKDYKRADEIRNILSERGIILEDTPQGVKWRKK
ncbi:MAG: cysteine--tRNA ligase [Spirochaetales bacterium]|nr:cysteine--tRNA ligase [Spirochaetales bacterium]